jgi:hypothetical protein
MIIGVAGKIGSGKDTVGNIIQYLKWLQFMEYNQVDHPFIKDIIIPYISDTWLIKKFADSLKDIVSILTGCTKSQLEDQDFKNTKLPDEWIRYGYADGFYNYYKNGKVETMMNNVQCDKERYDLEYRTNWQTAYKVHPTYRELLQYLSTDLLRNKLHNDVWVNALMSKYYGLSNNTHGRVGKEIPDGYEYEDISGIKHKVTYPNWIITDVRFPNEVKAIKDKGGIVIKLTRDISNGAATHISETALDGYTFDYIIDNSDGDINKLIEKVKDILINERIL